MESIHNVLMSRHEIEKLDLDFVLDRLIVYSPYGEIEKRNMIFFDDSNIELLNGLYDDLEQVIERMQWKKTEFIALHGMFKEIKNLNHTFSRLEENQVLSEVELFEIKNYALLVNRIRLKQEKLHWQCSERYKIESLESVYQLLDPEKTGNSTFYIYDIYSETLKEIRKSIAKIEEDIKNKRTEKMHYIENKYQLKFKSCGEIIVSKMKSDLIEKLEGESCLDLGYENMMHKAYILTNQEVAIYEDKLADLKVKEQDEIFQIRKSLSHTLSHHQGEMRHVAKTIGKIDLLFGKAYFSIGNACVRPILIDDEHIDIQEGVNLKVKYKLNKDKLPYQPVSIKLNKGVTCITGANMGGKTVSLKMIGMLVGMAQLGLFIPAKRMVYKPRKKIFVSIGDFQSIDKGLSTFGGEIENIALATSEVEESWLILIDELARGTNPKEGYAISKAVIKFLSTQEAITIITTHFDGLVDDEVGHYQVSGLKKETNVNLEKTIKTDGFDGLQRLMDYSLVEATKLTKIPKEAIRIAEIMGLNQQIIEDAKLHLGGLENEE